MASLGIYAATAFGFWPLEAWLLALAARAVGSRRGRFGPALLIVLAVFALGVVFLGFGILLDAMHLQGLPALVIAVIFPLTELLVVFAFLRVGFGLSTRRAFAPFGVYIGFIIVGISFGYLVLRPYLVQSFVMPSKGMSPTLEPNDRFMVNKLLRPRRMDLVAYRVKGDEPQVFVQRLIGLPGERLRFEAGGLLVNDEPLALPPTLFGRCQAGVGPPSYWRYRDGQTITLGNDEYFFIGDNADISYDSRSLGPSHASSFVGVVDLIYWPLSKLRIMR